MLVIKQLMVLTDFTLVFFPYYGSQWLPSTVQLHTFFKIIFFCVQQRKEIHTGLKQHEVNYDRFNFGGNYLASFYCSILRVMIHGAIF